MPPDLYTALGLPRDATKADIRKAYRRAAKRAHPDAGGSAEAFKRVMTAQLVLLDEARRDRYDRTGTFDEDPPVDIKLARALEQLSFALDVTLANILRNKRDPREADMIVATTLTLAEMRRKAEEEIALYEATAEKWGRLAGRFGTKTEPNRIDALVRGKTAQLAMMTAQVKAKIDDLAEAGRILTAHTYRRDETNPQGPMTLSLSQMTSLWQGPR
jgi:curved DNA-binding protein CbpA